MRTAQLVLACGPVRDEQLQAGLGALDALGIPWNLPSLKRLGGHWRPYLAGDDGQRSDALRQAMTGGQPILMVRGGYGAIRTLNRLELDGFPPHSGPLFGFSDGTALLGAWQHRGWHCWTAPPLIQLPRLDSESLKSFATAWAGDSPRPLRGETLVCGQASGLVGGGNLCVLASVIGTPWEVDLAHKLLLIEDIGEPAYKVDRLLTQLLSGGHLDNIAGLLVGQFTGVDEGHAATILEVVTEVARLLGKPAAVGILIGHGSQNWSVPMSVPMRLTADADGSATLSIVSST